MHNFIPFFFKSTGKKPAESLPQAFLLILVYNITD